jgi:hypothetical protein
MKVLKITLAGVLLALASPVVALAQSAPQNSAAIESAALGSLSDTDRAQVRNILALLSTGQMEASTAVVQIDAVLSDSEVKSVLAEAKKANSDVEDAGQFIVDLEHPVSK